MLEIHHKLSTIFYTDVIPQTRYFVKCPMFLLKAQERLLYLLFPPTNSLTWVIKFTHCVCIVLLQLHQFESKLICGCVRLLPARGKSFSDLVDLISHACTGKRELFSLFVMFIISTARGADCARRSQ